MYDIALNNVQLFNPYVAIACLLFLLFNTVDKILKERQLRANYLKYVKDSEASQMIHSIEVARDMYQVKKSNGKLIVMTIFLISIIAMIGFNLYEIFGGF